MSFTATVAKAPRGSRRRTLGSFATTALLIGTAVMAPFSVPGGGLSAAYAASAIDPAAGQSFVSSDADSVPLDLEISVEDSGPAKPDPSAALYTLEQFMFTGSVNWGGYRFTYYSQQVLPGGGLAIPGRHVNDAGYVSDADGFIVLAGSAPKGTVYETPFGAPGKIYDRGTVGNHLDVYIR